MRRTVSALPSYILPIPGRLETLEGAPELPPQLDFVVLTSSSDSRTDDGYRRAYVDTAANLLTALVQQGQAPKRILVASSTGVYEQAGGEWINEDSPASPQYFTGKRLLEGEQVILSGPFPSTIVRFAGIYGPDRIRLLSRVARGEEVRLEGDPIYTNRIHRDDCAGIFRMLLGHDYPRSVYVGVDHEPVERSELLCWLAEQLGVPVPPVVSGADLSARLLRSNKRCSNRAIVEAGYQFRFPTFREGYGRLIEEIKASSRSEHPI